MSQKNPPSDSPPDSPPDRQPEKKRRHGSPLERSRSLPQMDISPAAMASTPAPVHVSHPSKQSNPAPRVPNLRQLLNPLAAVAPPAPPAARRTSSPAARRTSSPAARRPASPAARRPASPADSIPSPPAARRTSSPAARRPSPPPARRPSPPPARMREFDEEEAPLLPFIDKLTKGALRGVQLVKSVGYAGTTTIRGAIGILQTIHGAISRAGTRIIEETHARNRKGKLQAASDKIKSFENFLNLQKNQEKRISTNNVLRMITIELIIEYILSELLLDDIEKIKPYLVQPIQECINHYEYYFGWEEKTPNNIHKMIDNAYKEFKQKQDIRELIAGVFPNDRSITLNAVIDELIKLYTETFRSDTDISEVLTLDGRLRLIRQIGNLPETTELTVMKKNQVLSAVNYEKLLKKYMKSKEDVAKEMGKIRPPVEPTPVNEPIAVGIQRGRLTRDMSISGIADASFLPPLVQVTAHDVDIDIDIDIDDLWNSNPMGAMRPPRQARSESPQSPIEVEVVGPNGKTRQQKEVTAAMAAAAMAHVPRAKPIVKQTLKYMQTLQKTQEDREERYTEQIAEITAQMYENAEMETKILTAMHHEIETFLGQLHEEFYRGLDDVRKTDLWNKEIHRIFWQTYTSIKKFSEGRQEAVSKIQQMKTGKSPKKGGLKTHKRSKHIHNSTRKTRKMVTRKMHSRNKKEGYTKKK